MTRPTASSYDPAGVGDEHERRRRSEVVAYVAVNAFLVGVWVVTGFGYFWPGWFLAAGGLGLSIAQWQLFHRRGDSTDQDRGPARARHLPRP